MGAPAGFLQAQQNAKEKKEKEMTCQRAIETIFACAGKHDARKGEDPLDPVLCEDLERVRRDHIYGPRGEVRCNACFSQLLNLGDRFNPGTI